jgi:hypothetical protein
MQDLPKGISKNWLNRAREHSQWIKEKGINTRQEQLELLLFELEDEMALVEYLSRDEQ